MRKATRDAGAAAEPRSSASVLARRWLRRLASPLPFASLPRPVRWAFRAASWATAVAWVWAWAVFGLLPQGPPLDDAASLSGQQFAVLAWITHLLVCGAWPAGGSTATAPCRAGPWPPPNPPRPGSRMPATRRYAWHLIPYTE